MVAIDGAVRVRLPARVPLSAMLRAPGAQRLVNVTRQVQCLAEAHQTPHGTQMRVVLPPKSKQHLAGFMDPCPGRVKHLLVRYWFGGQPHQAMVADGERLLLPRRAHQTDCPHLAADETTMTSLASALNSFGRRSARTPSGLGGMGSANRVAHGKRGARRRRSMGVGAGAATMRAALQSNPHIDAAESAASHSVGPVADADGGAVLLAAHAEGGAPAPSPRPLLSSP